MYPSLPRLPLVFIACLLLGQSTFASNSKDKNLRWGKLSREEIALQEVSYDKDAHAVVLATTGALSYYGMAFSIEKHVRIKILDTEGVEAADISIPFYAKKGYEKITELKGQTLEVLSDGKIKKHKLDKDQIFEVELDDEWKEIRFALPAAKPGSIIEYSYTLLTENFTFLEGWVFQSEFPTLYSSFKAEIPYTLNYQYLIQGHRLYEKYKSVSTNEWTLENLPALESEPFTYNLLDYAERVRFQLHSYSSNSSLTGKETYFTDWESIISEVSKTHMFYDYLRRDKKLEEIIQLVAKNKTDSLILAKELYYYVQNNFTWNNSRGLLPDKERKDLLQEKEGNGTAINLMLVSLLQKAGINAYPAFISTKSHGRPNTKFPMLNQFNHGIGLATIGGQQYLFDAAGNALPFGVLPEEDLNETALLLSREKVKWVDLKDNTKTSTIIGYKADLNQSTHYFEGKWTGFDALEAAPIIQEKSYADLFNSQNSHLVSDSAIVKEEISTKNSLYTKLYFTDKKAVNKQVDRIYYSLPSPDFLNSNPFKKEERNLPVDFGFSSVKTISCNIILPEGFRLEEKPEDILLVTPGDKAYFTYRSAISNGMLSIFVQLEIKEPLVSVSEYPHLREFFNRFISHYQQPLVLSRQP